MSDYKEHLEELIEEQKQLEFAYLAALARAWDHNAPHRIDLAALRTELDNKEEEIELLKAERYGYRFRRAKSTIRRVARKIRRLFSM